MYRFNHLYIKKYSHSNCLLFPSGSWICMESFRTSFQFNRKRLRAWEAIFSTQTDRRAMHEECISSCFFESKLSLLYIQIVTFYLYSMNTNELMLNKKQRICSKQSKQQFSQPNLIAVQCMNNVTAIRFFNIDGSLLRILVMEIQL